MKVRKLAGEKLPTGSAGHERQKWDENDQSSLFTWMKVSWFLMKNNQRGHLTLIPDVRTYTHMLTHTKATRMSS